MSDILFLLTGHFCNSPPQGASLIDAAQGERGFSRIPRSSFVVSQGVQMMSLKDSSARPAFRRETKSLSPVLAPTKGQAPIAELSPSKRHALVSCFNAGGLNKKDGAWHGPQGGKPISGITTADLARDGMLTRTVQHRNGSARLTERGNWFARTLLSDGTPLTRTE